METTTLSSKYRLVLPKAIPRSLNLKLRQRFMVRASECGIELVPCEPVSALRSFLEGADTDLDDIRTWEERV